MAKVNACLKRSFKIVIALNVILSSLQLVTTLVGHAYGFLRETYGEYGIYGFSIIPLIFTSLGLYGACKEKLCPLIVFAIGMILGCVCLTKAGITGLVIRPKIVEEIKWHYLNMLPLARASESFLEDLEFVQHDKHCCGLIHGYQDWGYNISMSCLCHEEFTNSCVIAPVNSSIYDQWHFYYEEVTVPVNSGVYDYDQSLWIYKEPCFPYFFANAILTHNITLGIILGFLLLWGTPLVLSIFIMCQVNRRVETLGGVDSEEAKTGVSQVSLEDAAGFT